VPLFFFRIRHGRYSGASDSGIELADRDAAWRELTSVCADIVSGISRKLKQNSEWEMELLDESRRPVFGGIAGQGACAKATTEPHKKARRDRG
jgi:hypothetical protein